MDISHLTSVLPVPAIVDEAVSYEQWEVYETITGIALPADYKAFLHTYGTGNIGAVIFLRNPFSKQKGKVYYYKCTDWMEEVIGITELQLKFGREVFPYSLYPKAGGVFPWGHTDNGDELYWLTSENPDDWTILVNETRSSNFEHFECNMSTFLAGYITGSIHSEILQTEWMHSTAENRESVFLIFLANSSCQ